LGSIPLILLDTHVLWWLDQQVSSLGTEARALADDALSEGELCVSAISFCEIAALVRQGRLGLQPPMAAWRRNLVQRGLLERMVDGEIAISAVDLPAMHRDPADRIIVATALALDATLLTADERILAWSGPLRRADARR
jgi:PIN domain nuclease of toxin-antitoxin system